MPPRIPSSELGEAPFAVVLNKRTGRPVRKSRKTQAQIPSPYVNSTTAVSEASDEDEEYQTVEIDDSITSKKTRKRKRSPSPPLPFIDDDGDDLPDENEDDLSHSARRSSIGSDSAIDVSHERHDGLNAQTQGFGRDRAPVSFQQRVMVPPLQLTFNVPKGHKGPFVVNLDLQNVLEDMAESIVLHNDRTALSTQHRIRPEKKQRPVTTTANAGTTKATTNSNPPRRSTRAGFLDLPAELRNEIYRMVFVSSSDLDFSMPTNFGRNAALLRTCRQVHSEGRSILYSENDFYFNRRTQRYGSFWEWDWNEIGYRSIRKFLKSIGPTNTSLIRRVTFLFEDAVPSLNPRTTCNEERRFVHDDALMSVLRHLSDYGALQRLTMHFVGRKMLLMCDTRFIENLKRVRADEVLFAKYSSPRSLPGGTLSKVAQNVTDHCMKTMARKNKLYGPVKSSGNCIC